MSDLPKIDLAALRRRARILLLMDGATRAGLCPIGIIPLHAFAFLSNVLAPTWDMPALEGKVLKRRGGPFYPQLQADIDRMVGMGMLTIEDVTHVQDEAGRWRLEGRYRLNQTLARNAVEYLTTMDQERQFSSFVEELAFALSILGEQDLGRALIEDATYADPNVSEGNVLDFDEWAHRNPSFEATELFESFAPGGFQVSPGEKLHLYVRHLHGRLHAS